MRHRIKIMLESPERESVEFTIFDKMPLGKLMQDYADYFGLDRDNLYFRTRGLLIVDTDTAYLLHIDSGCTIEVTEKY